MIHVRARPEPPDPEAFARLVTAPGQRWLAAHAEAAGGDAEPYWREAIPQLRWVYKHICAYFCCWVGPASGAGSVDHLVAKSVDRSQIYRWTNYRFACARMNARKGAEDILDPFDVVDGCFALDFRLGAHVVVGEGVEGALRARVEHAINQTLKLNAPECVKERTDYLDWYLTPDLRSRLPFQFLIERAPFVALELARQGLLHPEDQHITSAEIRRWLDEG